MDRLTAMSVFVKAVELGSFSAAGDALDMSPQLVGKHVLKLEQHLGVQLLNRTTRRQSLTDFGRSYYERCRIILSEVEMAEGLAAATKARPSGRLRINAPVSFGMYTLAPRLPDYMKMYPDVSVELVLSNRMIDLVDEGFDVVFRVGELSDSGLIAKSLAPYKLALCAAPAYFEGSSGLNHPSELARHECLVYAHSELRTDWTFIGPDGLVTVPIKGRFVADHGEPLLCAARAGLGIILQPLELLQTDLARGDLVELLPDYQVIARPLHILHAADRRPTPKLRSFMDFAAEAFGRQSASS